MPREDYNNGAITMRKGKSKQAKILARNPEAFFAGYGTESEFVICGFEDANNDDMVWNNSNILFDIFYICPKMEPLDEACIIFDLIITLRNTKRMSARCC